MSSKDISNGILRACGTLFLIVVLGYLLYLILPLIAYILISMVITLIGRPIVRIFRFRFKMNVFLAVGITMFLFVVLGFGVVSMVIPLLISQGKNLAMLDVQTLRENINHLTQETLRFLNIQYDTSIWNWSDWIQIEDIPNFINILLGFLSSFGIGFFSVLFITFFFLKDGRKIENLFLRLIPKQRVQATRNTLASVKNLLSRYFVGLLIQVSVLFIIYTCILLLFGVENAVIIALLCALLNLIPYLGPVISFFIMTILTMTTYIGSDFSTVILPKTIYVAIGFALAQLLDNFVNQPLIFSNSVKSHPLEIFCVILCGGYFYGIIGMVIAIPVYTVIKVILKEFMGKYAVVQQLTKGF